MSDNFILHGDVESFVIEILTDLTPEIPPTEGFTISTDLRNYNEGDRWVVVNQEGGTKSLHNIINKPRVDLHFRAEKRHIARDAAEIYIASLFRAVGYRSGGCSLSQVLEETGLAYVPDKYESNSYRYIYAARLTILADESTSNNTFLQS